MDNETLANLQDLILEHVLTSTPLPGQDSSISFPDLAYVTQSEEKLILDEGYLGETSRPRSSTRTTWTDVSPRHRPATSTSSHHWRSRER